MGKYIFKILISFTLFLLLRQNSWAKIVAIYPPNGQVIDIHAINFKWENTDTSKEYIYRHEYSMESYFGLSMVSQGLLKTEVLAGPQNYSIYYWRVRYHPKDTFVDTYDFVSDIFVFGLNKEIPVDILERFVKKTEPIEEKESKEIPLLKELPIVESKQVQDISKKISTPKILKKEENIPKDEFNWNVSPSIKSVLGVSTESTVVCKFKYVKRGNKTEKIFCNIPKLKLTEQYIYAFGKEYSIIVNGDVVSKFNIQVDEYICNFNLLRPSTWFKCEEKFLKSNILEVSPNMFFHIYKGDTRVSVLSYILNGNTFKLLAGHVKDGSDMEMVHTYRIVNGDYNIYIEEKSEYTLTLVDYDFANSGSSKPFVFPFEKIIGVTQWYGYTEYQGPHTGIDFGAYKENILAVDDGEVMSKGWDSYYGECLSGGNYVKVKQSNGMYTVYFHLDDIYVNTGDLVKKGVVIGKSGNSGAWNCQQLGYHLHFETRLNSSSGSHSNPVGYINTDWSNVPTIGYSTYPGRLTGENPHPGK